MKSRLLRAILFPLPILLLLGFMEHSLRGLPNGYTTKRDMLERHLAQAKRHVAQGKAHIEKQHRIIADLQSKGHDMAGAKDLLAQIIHYILPHRVEDHRLKIREEEAGQDHHKVESGKTGEGLHRCWMPSHILHQPSREARRGGQLRLRHWPQIEVYRYHRYVET